MPVIRCAEPEDLQHFLALADREGWRVLPMEMRNFRQTWRHSAFALVSGGIFCGFVTAVAYQRSGWVGNLIVPQALRGRGYGATLFQTALDSLEQRGILSVWLTASEMGRPLYERHGFREVDVVERWRGRCHSPDPLSAPDRRCPWNRLLDADRRAWGEDRGALLEALEGFGKIYASHDNVACLQSQSSLQIVGPWYAPTQSLSDNRLLLESLLANADPDCDMVIDLFSSSPVRRLLVEIGFHCVGVNTLMVRGDGAQVDRDAMVALASLGSVG